MPQIKRLWNATNRITDESGHMSQPFREHMLFLGRSTEIIGTGSPEGVVLASQYTLYIDETVPTVPVQYRKMLTDIGGDIKQGWIQV